MADRRRHFQKPDHWTQSVSPAEFAPCCGLRLVAAFGGVWQSSICPALRAGASGGGPVTLVRGWFCIEPSASRRRPGRQKTLDGVRGEFIAHDPWPQLSATDRRQPDHRCTERGAEANASNRAPVWASRSAAKVLSGVLVCQPAASVSAGSGAGAVSAMREDVVTRRGHVRLSVHSPGGNGTGLADRRGRSARSPGRGATRSACRCSYDSRNGTDPVP